MWNDQRNDSNGVSLDWTYCEQNKIYQNTQDTSTIKMIFYSYWNEKTT